MNRAARSSNAWPCSSAAESRCGLCPPWAARRMQELLDEFGHYAIYLLIFAVTVFSWVAGKLKEWSMRNAGANKPTPPQPQPARVRHDQDEEEEEEPTPDLAVLLGLSPRRERRPQSPPPTARPPTSAAPSARPAPEPPESAPPPPIARPVDRAAPPSPSVRPKSPTPATRPAPAPTPQPASRRPAPQPAPAEPDPAPTTPPPRRFRRARFGRLNRSELRRAIILAEVLDKPLALRDESI